MSRLFPLRLDPPWRWPLRLIGVRPGTAQVELSDDGRLVAVYGPFSVATSVDNICSYQRTGPYRWWKAIGPRRSLADRGFTFGTSARAGICLCFDEPVSSGYVHGGRMESLTVMLKDDDGLVRELERRGIAGIDARGKQPTGGALARIMRR